VDINKEVARQRAKEEAASLDARRIEASQQVALDRRRALDEATQVQLRPLAESFIRWVRQSNIPPKVLDSTWKKTLFGGRSLPIHKGWILRTKDTSDQDSRVQKLSILAVLTTGEIQWVGWPQGSIVVPGEVEQLIADFIVKSRSTVSWPG
jgi:hypothetical protein